MKRLSIVIVTHNSEEHIFDCVGAIKKWADLPLKEVELIVVDNKSSEVEAMFKRLKQLWGEDIILVKNTVNGGYGQGNNLGIHRATAPVVLIMNPDVRLYEPIFQRALRYFDDNEIGLLGMVQMRSATCRSNHSFCPTWCINGYIQMILYAVCNRIDCYLPQWMYIQGSCFFVRREMFLAIGGYDETNFLYGEEEDLYYRLKVRYGVSCFAFDRHLHYIHITSRRQPSLEYEKTLYAVNVALYEKKGFDKTLILRHFLQANRLLLFKESIRDKHGVRYDVLHAFRQFLLEQQ